MRSGLLAEFATADALEHAFEALRGAGYTRLDAWTPYAVHGLVHRGRGSPVPGIMLVAGLTGGALGYLVQWWCAAAGYPVDVGGRPLHSAPAFIPITFESTVLASAVVGFVAMLWYCRLPRLHHPLFDVEGFERASVDRFWLGVDDADPIFEENVSSKLEALGALRCARVGGLP